MSLDQITVNKTPNELWVRLRITMKDGTKHTGWCYIPGDNDWVYWLYEPDRKKALKRYRILVNYHIDNNELIRLCERYFEEVPIVELNTSQIKTFTITDRVFGIPVEVWEAEDKARYERYQAMRGDKNGD